MSLNKETVEDGEDDTLPMATVTSSVSPFERALNVADFMKHFKSIGKKNILCMLVIVCILK